MSNITEASLSSRIFAWLNQALFQNLALKLFSLLIALLLWLFVLGWEDVTSTEDINITFKTPEGMLLVSDVPDSVKVTVKGPWAAMKSWNPGGTRKTVDISSFKLGLGEVFFEESLFSLPQSLKITRITPSKLMISLAKKSKKTVPINPIVSGKPALGYMVKLIVTKPETIDIEGAEADILIIDEVPTEEIDIEGRRTSITEFTYPAKLSKNISYPDNGHIAVTITIKKDLVERTFENVMIEVINSSHMTKLEPDSVSITIVGPRQLILNLPKNQVRAFIDASLEEGDLQDTITTREIEFDSLPEGIKIKAGLYTTKLTILQTKLPEIQPKENKGEGKPF